jgi:hypothetical protein
VFQPRLPNDLKTVLRALEPFRERLVKGLAVESTFNWCWLVDGLQDHGYAVQLVNTVKALEADAVGQWVSGEAAVLLGQTNVRVIECLDAQIKGLEKEGKVQLKLLPDYHCLEQIPGIGEVLNLVILLETGPIERFAGAGNYVSYCRGVRAEKLSNQRKKDENNRQCGNKYLAWAWLEAANFALRYRPESKRWYQRKLQRCGGKTVLALKAVAAKLAKAAYYMLKNQEAFKMKPVFG